MARRPACSRGCPICSSTACAGFYRVTLDFVLRSASSCCCVTFATGYRRHVALRQRAQGLLPRGGHRLPARHHRGASRTPAFTRNVARGRSSCQIISRRTRRSTTVTSAVGFGGATNKGFLFIKLKPKDERGPVDQGHGAPARARRRSSPASARCCSRCRTSNSPAAASPAPNINTRCNRATSTRSIRQGAGSWSGRWRKLPGLRDVNSDLQISNPQTTRRHRPRQGGGLRHHDRRRCAPRSTTPIGTRQISTIFTEADDYEVILEAIGEVPERSDRARPHPRRHARRPARAARRGRDACGARSGRCRSIGSRSSRR